MRVESVCEDDGSDGPPSEKARVNFFLPSKFVLGIHVNKQQNVKFVFIVSITRSNIF